MVVVLAAALLACVWAAATPVVAAAADVPFLLAPVSSAATADLGYHEIHAQVGRTYSADFVVANTTAEAIELKVAPVEGQTAQFGGIAYSQPGKAVTATGTWLSLDAQTIRVAARGEQVIRVKVNVPSDAAPGDHITGVAAWMPDESEKGAQAGQGQAGASVKIAMRQVVAIHVVVAGPAARHMTVSDVKPLVAGAGVYLAIEQKNDGQLFTEGTGVITVAQDAFKAEFTIDKTVPGTSWISPVFWSKAPPNGEYDVEVVIDYGNGTEQTAWSGEVVIGNRQSEQIEKRVVGATGVKRGIDWGWWLIIGSGVVFVALLMWLVFRLGRRGRRADRSLG